MHLSALIPALFGSLAAAAQLPFALDRTFGSAGLGAESSPSFITADGFTTLSHPDFAKHSVRIKKHPGDWCDDVRSYSGYIDSEARHLFFYYFDSRSDPSKDDLLLWLNGGPGCSSSLGLFMELGPCQIAKDGNTTVKNPYSWNSNQNMIFIDQPVNVGFSYSTSGISVGTTEEAAIDIHAFLSIFLSTFTEFEGRPLHLSGESYGGRYLPVFASEIVYQNTLLAAQPESTGVHINLKSVLIGNGLTDAVTMATSYYEQACSSQNGLGKPVLDIKTCMEMQKEVKRCDAWLERVCRKNVIQPECDIAAAYCSEQFENPLIYAGINPYDISKPCTSLAEDLCYPESIVINQYLDKASVRELLGVDARVGAFQSCSNQVGVAFAQTRDGLAPTFFHVTALLENGIRLLFYVGTWDWICNYIGNYRMLQALEWSGRGGYLGEALREWTLPSNTSHIIGETKSFGLLSWATIYGAGHMVPLDKPQEALHMVNSWIAGESF